MIEGKQVISKWRAEDSLVEWLSLGPPKARLSEKVRLPATLIGSCKRTGIINNPFFLLNWLAAFGFIVSLI